MANLEESHSLMSEVKKRRMIHLKVEPKSSPSSSFSQSKIFDISVDAPTSTDDISINQEPEIFYNFNSDDELNDNPLKFSRSPSPASSTNSCKSIKDIFMLKDDLRRIANDPMTCTTTMNNLLEALHNYFPWLPDNAYRLKNKTIPRVEPELPIQTTVKAERTSIMSANTKDRNMQYVMIENKELDEMKKNIEIIKEGQQTLLKEFQSFKDYRPIVKLMNTHPGKFKLPFIDLEVFMKFDQELLTDEEAKEQLIQIYMTEVEFDPEKYIKKNLKKLFTSDVAIKFSFRGRQGNICAEKSNTIQVLRDCTEQLYPQCSKDLFERCATKFFYYVKDKLTKTQKSLSSKRGVEGDHTYVNTVEFVLPFTEIESFKSFDASVSKDAELAQQLKLMFFEETVLEYKRFLLNNFKKIFTNDLANQLSFNERQGSLNIREFNLIKIMRNCVLERYDATENNFYNCAKQYLLYVKQKGLEAEKKIQNISVC